MMTVGEVAEAVAQYCLLTHASVTSGGRTEARNVQVGGVAYSAHRFHRGADVVYDAELPSADRKILGARLGLLVLIESDHDHLQPYDWPRG